MAQRSRSSDAERPVRRAPAKKSGGGLWLILLLVAGGAVFALHHMGKLGPAIEDSKNAANDVAGQVSEEIRKLSDPTPVPAGSTVAPGSPAGATGPGPAGTSTPVAPSTSPDPKAVALARSKLAAAGDHFAAGNFREAVDLLDAFAATRPAVGAQLAGELELFRSRAFEHWIATKDFVRDGRLDGATTILTMMDGRVLEVRILSEADGKIKYVWKGIKAEVEAKGVLQRTTLDPAEVKKRDVAAFDAHLTEAKGGGPPAYLAVIKYCVERDLREKIPYVVERATAERPQFFEELFEAHAAMLYRRYLVLSQKGQDRERKQVYERLVRDYPGTVVARELVRLTSSSERPVEPTPEQQEVVAKAIEEKLEPAKTVVAGGNAQARQLVAEADAKYAEAMREYRLGFPGQPDADKHTKNAWEMFKAAQALYEKAFEMTRSDAIEAKITLCQREIYSCQKQFKIGGIGK